MFRRMMMAAVVMLMAAQADANAPAFEISAVGDEGRVVYLLPGLASPGSVWDLLAEELLAQGYQVHIVTLAGFAGQPPLTGEEFLPEVQRQLAARLRQHQGPKPVLVGHSLGAFMAYWLAATEPDQVAGVVAIDGLPYLAALGNPQATPENQRVQAEQLATFMASLTPEQYAQQNRMAMAGMITAEDDVDRMAYSGGRSAPATVGRAVAEMLTIDLRPLMPAIKAPVVLIQAADSGASDVTRQAFAGQVAEIPDHRHLVADRGRHFVPLDDPDFVAAAVLELLGGLDHE